MEVSTEISQKIRSAIKAKLMELGAYVDDELPDYIMVMVANKKSRAQMSGDLALFLGTNTDAFTEWLHGLLGKLQTITVESGEKGKIKGGKDRKKDKKDGSKEKKKLKKRSSDSTSKRKSSIDKNEQNQMSESLSGSLVESVTQSSVLKEDSSVTKDHSHGYDVSATTTISPDVDPEMDDQKNIQEDVEDVRQLLVTGTQADELAEELETTEAEVERSKALTSGRNKTAYAKEKELVTRLVSHSSSSTKSKSRSPSPEKLDAGSRKRKIPISVVASVSRKCDNEEEYDPYNPAVGSVASVVKVTARKSSVPASLQANRESDDKDSQASNVDGGQVGLEEPPSKMIKLSEIGHIDDIKKALEEVLKKSQERLDDISHFSKMVESSLRKLRPQVVSLAKIRIEQVFFELESEEYVPRQRASDVNSKHILCNNHNQNSVKLSLEKSKKTTESIILTPHGSDSPLPAQNLTSAVKKNSEIASIFSSSKLKHSPLVKEAAEVSNYSFRDSNRLSTSEADSKSKGNNTERIIFRPNSKLVSSELSSMRLSTSVGTLSVAVNPSKGERASSQPKTISADSAGKIRERRFSEQKKLQDAIPRSPVSSSKIDSGSPSSVHSCPPSSTSGFETLAVRRCIVTTSTVSRDSTLSPTDSKHEKCTTSQPEPSLLKTGLEKPVASILVDSIHNKRRPDAESTSVLKQSWNRSPGLKLGNIADCEDDSPRISSEALKVMAKNLKVTVINKRATRLQDASSSEDSSSDEDDDDDDGESSDDEEELGDEEKKSLDKGNENSKSSL